MNFSFGTPLARRAATAEASQRELPSLLNRLPSAELAALSRETDPEMYYEALLAFGVRQEHANHITEAAASYAAVCEGITALPFASESHRRLLERARSRLETLQGNGDVGPRVEFILRHLARESTDPSTLVAMTVGTTAFRVTRLAMLSRLLASPGGFWTRGLAARSLAGFAAFAVESPLFALSGKTMRQSLGETESWNPSALLREIGTAYLFLGAMKLSGWAADTTWQRLAPAELANSELSRGLFRQAGLLGGILLDRRLERGLGLRPEQNGSMTLVDSLGTLAQLAIAGRISAQLLGPTFQAWENGLDLRGERLLARFPRSGAIPPLEIGRPALAGTAEAWRLPPPLLMNSMDPKGPASAGEAVALRTTDLYMILVNLRRALTQEQPCLSYDGTMWVESRDAPTIAGRLRQTAPLPREKTFELFLIQQGQRVIFFWEGNEINYRVEGVESAVRPQQGRTPSQILENAVTLPRMPATRMETLRARADASTAESERKALIWNRYESETDRLIEEFYRQIVGQNGIPFPALEESSALRGRRLARIVNRSLMLEMDAEDTQPSLRPFDVAVRIHSFLERAYRHLDFGTLQSFQERVSSQALENFGHALNLYNQNFQRSHPPLPGLAEMPTDLPGNYLIPRTEGLRQAFLAQLFARVPEAELTAQIPGLFRNPKKMGALFASALQPALRQMVSDAFQLEGMIPREKLPELLNPERPYRSEEAKALQVSLLNFAREIPELRRILVQGRGTFHREFLRSMFFDSETPLKDVYPQFYAVSQKIPPSLLEADGTQTFLPTLGQLRKFTGR